LHALAAKVHTPAADRPELVELAPDKISSWPEAELARGGTRDLRKIPGDGTVCEHLAMLTGFSCGYGAVFSNRYRIGIGLRWDERVFPWAWTWLGWGAGRRYSHSEWRM
jgi:hypothetical protein